MKLPQLRILATNYCGRHCVYCRPSGEGVECIKNECINLDLVTKIARLYKKRGGSEIKITGGDPVFWDDIVECVRILKKEIGIESVELITRSPKLINVIDDLIECGLDTLNFSLDTLDRKKFHKITGVDDFDSLYKAILECSNKEVACKLNMVIMKDINSNEVDDMVEFCKNIKFKQLKLLDMISDLHNTDSNNNEYLRKSYNKNLDDLFIPLEEVTYKVKENAVTSEVIFQGGLGHPMNRYVLEGGLEIIVKDAINGAWYGSECKKCSYFPCHDALMALRLTSNGKMQFCLLRDNNCIDLKSVNDDEMEKLFISALNIYENAYFVGNNIVDGEVI